MEQRSLRTFQERSTTPVFPRAVWGIIAGHCDLRTALNLKQLCHALHANTKISDEVFRVWFKELAEKMNGEGAEDAIAVLNYCRDNIRHIHILLAVLDKLLRQPQPNTLLAVEENGIDQPINRLTRILYRDSASNPKALLQDTVRFLASHQNPLSTTPSKLIEQNKKYDQRMRVVGYVGMGVCVTTVLVQFWGIISRSPLSRSTPWGLIMLAGALLASAPTLSKSRWADSIRYSRFWRRVDALPIEEQVGLIELQRLRGEERNERSNMKAVVGITLGATAGVILVSLLMVYIILSMTSGNEPTPTMPPKGPSL